MDSSHFHIDADYNTFYIMDVQNSGDVHNWSDGEVDAMLCIRDYSVGISTFSIREVPVYIHIGNKYEVLDAIKVEANVDFKSSGVVSFPSGEAYLMGPTGYYPEAPRIKVPEKTYEFIALYRGKQTVSSDKLDGEDSYSIFFFPFPS